MDDGSDFTPTLLDSEPDDRDVREDVAADDADDIDDAESDDREGDSDTDDDDETGVYIDRWDIDHASIDRIVRRSLSSIRVSFLEDRQRNCRNILQHCKRVIDSVKIEYGDTVCIFKIGITSEPVTRFSWYRAENLHTMTLLHISGSIHLTDMLESALIQSYNHVRGCRNIKLGGDGPMHRFDPPYYTYVVAARADGRLRIGGWG